MKPDSLHLTYIGGPTAVIEFGGVRLLTDPTFDPAGGEYTTGLVTLRKLAGPALERDAVGPFDYVLLSHDHHSDNLDHAGRATLASAKKVLTTDEGSQRLGDNSVGLKDWQNMDIPAPGGRVLRVVATPARHGPEGLSRGAVIGFALFFRTLLRRPSMYPATRSGTRALSTWRNDSKYESRCFTWARRECRRLGNFISL